MKRMLACWSVALWLSAQGAYAQTSSTGAATGDKAQQEKGEVQVGAGSKGDVTTGSSGGKATKNPVVTPAEPGFPIVPATDPFRGPGMLEVKAPKRLRCELINDQNARGRCEEKKLQASGGKKP